ncbi:transmembrane and ubiquitin-like domain-containing protein 1 [Orussus abietinus]|uniref:transmembrane and ubiquitin-like domain-containing protein 1 n=1 Tax=Orussus abietinus TaxID=222816 RepID=UPI00062647D0|nr:transmembrane and ubiquitin-like domain-containing protein 1 [Orussus abietinus]XP_012286153.1 transmembrane and ubiquitin-like domain-containing protein 1 [Orussus abietinus]
MTLIEGVGDEVTDFFIAVGVLLVGWVAWYSTNIVDQPLIRTVLILQNRTRTRVTELRSNHRSVDLPDRPPSLDASEQEESVDSNANTTNTIDTECPAQSSLTASNEAQSEPNASALPATSEEVLIEAMDSDNDNSRLQKETDKVDVTDAVTESEQSVSIEEERQNILSDDANKISIKLKFINDDQKLVTGSLNEILGDFKKRHFQVELQSQKLVRLVFNGQLLQPDTHTLERCGLYNNCVVHCLIHQLRTSPTTSPQATILDNTSPIYFRRRPLQDMPTGAGVRLAHNEWDLSVLLASLLTLMLGLAWYSRYYYAQIFTATTTLALYGLTAIFTISLVSHFLPDTDSIRDIE